MCSDHIFVFKGISTRFSIDLGSKSIIYKPEVIFQNIGFSVLDR